MPTLDEKTFARFDAKISEVPEAGCWIWMGAHDRMGYGNLMVAGRNRKAYRVAYEHFRGDVPSGLEIDHLCRTPSCVNPWHLEAVTHVENVRRGRAGENHRLVTQCPKGHPYDAENTGINSVTGGRFCRECKRSNSRNYARARYVPRGAGPRATRTHCPRGHAYDQANTHVDRKGGRICRACARERMRAKSRNYA